MGAKSPRTIGGSPISLMVYVEDVDARVAQAVAAGAKLTRPVANQFYGDRTGGIDDPFGYHWYHRHSRRRRPARRARNARGEGDGGSGLRLSLAPPR